MELRPLMTDNTPNNTLPNNSNANNTTNTASPSRSLSYFMDRFQVTSIAALGGARKNHPHHHHHHTYRQRNRHDASGKSEFRVTIPSQMLFYAAVLFIALPLLLVVFLIISHVTSTNPQDLHHVSQHDTSHHNHKNLTPPHLRGRNKFHPMRHGNQYDKKHHEDPLEIAEDHEQESNQVPQGNSENEHNIIKNEDGVITVAKDSTDVEITNVADSGGIADETNLLTDGDSTLSGLDQHERPVVKVPSSDGVSSTSGDGDGHDPTTSTVQGLTSSDISSSTSTQSITSTTVLSSKSKESISIGDLDRPVAKVPGTSSITTTNGDDEKDTDGNDTVRANTKNQTKERKNTKKKGKTKALSTEEQESIEAASEEHPLPSTEPKLAMNSNVVNKSINENYYHLSSHEDVEESQETFTNHTNVGSISDGITLSRSEDHDDKEELLLQHQDDTELQKGDRV